VIVENIHDKNLFRAVFDGDGFQRPANLLRIARDDSGRAAL